MGIKAWLEQKRFSDSFLLSASTILFFPLVLFLRLVGGTWLTSNHHYPSLVQSLVLLAVVCGLWLGSKIISKRGFVTSGIEQYIVPFLGAICFSAVFSSNPSLSAEKALGAGVFLVLALILLELRKRQVLWEGLINSILLTVLFATLLSLLSLVQALRVYQFNFQDFLSRPDYIARSLPRLPNILNLHITISAGYYLMAFPLAVYRFIKTKKQFLKGAIVLGGGASLGVFFMIQSRGSIIGLALMILAVIFLERKRIREKINQHPRLAFGIGSVGLALLGMGFYYIFLRRGFSFTGRSVLCRTEAWKTAFQIIWHNPLFGSGQETFGYLFLESRRSDICDAVLHVTHNDLLQILVNFGLAGLGALVYFALKYWELIKEDLLAGKDQIKTGLPALASMAGMGLMTTMLYSPNIRFLFLFYLVWMIPEAKLKFRQRTPRAIAAAFVILVLMGAAGGWILWKIQPYYQARSAFQEDDFLTAEDKLELAQERDPEISYYQQALAFVKAQNYCSTNSDLDGAIGQYQRSLERVDILPADHANLASLLENRGDHLEAIAAIEDAIELNLQKYSYQCMLGEYLIGAGQSNQALDPLADCLSRESRWLDTPYWDGLLLPSNMEDQIIALAVDKIQARQETDKNLEIGKLFYFAGDWNQAVSYLDLYRGENPKDYEVYTYLALISLQQKEYQAAAELSRKAIDLFPRCQPCWSMLAEAELELDNLQEAEKALAISYHIFPTPGTQILFARLSLARGDPDGAVNALRLVEPPALPLDKYSHWISSRWSLHTSQLQCLPAGLTYQDYYLPLAEGGAILEELAAEELGAYFNTAMSPDRISREYFLDDYQKSIPVQ